MSTKRIRLYESFRNKRRKLNEAVVQRDNTFLVGGIKVDAKLIKKYISLVKDKTGRDLSDTYSNSELAEELVKWATSTQLDNIDNVPVSAILGGEEEMAQDAVEETDELSYDEEGADEMGDMDMEDEISVEEVEDAPSDVPSDEDDLDLDLDLDSEEADSEEDFEDFEDATDEEEGDIEDEDGDIEEEDEDEGEDDLDLPL
jgi:hypothetical protein